MMFEVEDCQALQTPLDNNSITAEDQCTPIWSLNAIQTIIKDEGLFWHYNDEVLSDLRQHPDKGINVLNTCITILINNCKFWNDQTKETLNITLLQHSV